MQTGGIVRTAPYVYVLSREQIDEPDLDKVLAIRPAA